MIWIDNSGRVCEGQYIIVKDAKVLNGIATVTYSNGFKFEGYFDKGIKQGPFKITDMNRNLIIVITYDNDIIQTDDNNMICYLITRRN